MKAFCGPLSFMKYQHILIANLIYNTRVVYDLPLTGSTASYALVLPTLPQGESDKIVVNQASFFVFVVFFFYYVKILEQKKGKIEKTALIIHVMPCRLKNTINQL